MSVHKVEKRFLTDYVFREGKRKLKLKVIGGVVLFIFLFFIKSASNGSFPPTFVFFIGTVYGIVKLGKAFKKIGRDARSTIFLVQGDKVAKIVFNKEIDFAVNSYTDLGDYTNSILYHQTFLTDNISNTSIKDGDGIYIKSEKSYTLDHDGEIYIPIEVNDYKALKAKILKRNAVYKVSNKFKSATNSPHAYTQKKKVAESVKKEINVNESPKQDVPEKKEFREKQPKNIAPEREANNYKKDVKEVPKREPVFKKPELKPKEEKTNGDYKHRYKTKDRKYY